MRGAVDRGGSREGKKSLRKNKITLNKEARDVHKPTGLPQLAVSPAAPEALGSDVEDALIDCGAQLLNRQFDRDQLKVLQRSCRDGVQPLVVFTTDFEKQELLLRTCKENLGLVYGMTGIHSDMIKRNNEKLSAARLDALREAALRPETVAIMAGLDFGRDVGIRYAQERSLQQQLALAVEVQLPVVLYEVCAADALLEQLRAAAAGLQPNAVAGGAGASAPTSSHPSSPTAVQPLLPVPTAIYNFTGSERELRAFLAAGCHVIVTGRVCDPTEEGAALRQRLREVPLQRLLVASDAPFATPQVCVVTDMLQNIADTHLREGRNEPANLPYVVDALASEFGLSRQQLARTLRANAKAFFRLRDPGDDVGTATEEGVAAAVQPAAAPADGPAGAAAAAADACAPAVAPATDDDPADVAVKPELDHGNRSQTTTCKPAAAAAVPVPSRNRRNEPPPVAGAAPGTSHAAAGPPSTQDLTVRYACRNCRSILFSANDVLQHGNGHTQRANNARVRGELCSMHFLRLDSSLAAQASQSPPGPGNAGQHTQSATARNAGCGSRNGSAIAADDGDEHDHHEPASTSDPDHDIAATRLDVAITASRASGGRTRGATVVGAADPGISSADGKLQCPTCHSKIGRWALATVADEDNGVQCACGVVVSPPAFGVLRARIDIVDPTMNIAAAVESVLQLYEEDSSSEGSDGANARNKHSRKKRGKQRRNKTANFSSFRNKSYNAAEPVARSAATGAAAP